MPRRTRAEGEEVQTAWAHARPDGALATDLARRVLAHAASPEERLERLVAAHRRELEEQAARFEQAMRDLERREELLRDMRSSVERLLRLGRRDLSERERELQALGREFLQREERLGAEEAELSRRRSELGAVELRREALEQRERALAAREAGHAAGDAPAEEPDEEPQPVPRAVALLFVPGASYRLVQIAPRELERGTRLDLRGEGYLVSRVGPSPLPGDPRSCAYLEQGRREASGVAGSS